MIQVVISPPSLLEKGIKVEQIAGLLLFKFTDELQSRLEDLLEKNKTGYLTLENEVINLARGMRITVDDLLSYLASGITYQEILDDFP